MKDDRLWGSPLGDSLDLIINSVGPGDDHECRDCPQYGGIGFDCHHLVRGQRIADHCDWCKARGLTVGQRIPNQTPENASHTIWCLFHISGRCWCQKSRRA